MTDNCSDSRIEQAQRVLDLYADTDERARTAEKKLADIEALCNQEQLMTVGGELYATVSVKTLRAILQGDK